MRTRSVSTVPFLPKPSGWPFVHADKHLHPPSALEVMASILTIFIVSPYLSSKKVVPTKGREEIAEALRVDHSFALIWGRAKRSRPKLEGGPKKGGM